GGGRPCDGPWPPHAARDRDLQGQADLLRGRELFLRNRPPWSHASRLDRPDVARSCRGCGNHACCLFLCPTQRPERNGPPCHRCGGGRGGPTTSPLGTLWHTASVNARRRGEVEEADA